MKHALVFTSPLALVFAFAPGAHAQAGDASAPALSSSQAGQPADARGTGVVKAINPAQGTITLQHQAIASIGWPAMTMAFKVASTALLKNAKVGDTVRFRLHPDGMNSTVTAIEVITR